MHDAYLSVIILYCLKRFQGERTIYASYHLLNGKKSSQTIQDGKLYQLSNFFAVCHNRLPRNEYEKIVKNLEKRSYIKGMIEDKYILTKIGQAWLEEQLRTRPIPESLDGWNLHDKSSALWSRLSVIIQTLSNLIYDHTKFTPVTRDESVLQFVKVWLLRIPHNREGLTKKLYKEIHQFLSSLSNDDATIFVSRLSGYQDIGLTNEQLADQFEVDPFYIHLKFEAILHLLVQTLLTTSNNHEYQLLRSMVADIKSEAYLTSSTEQTFRYLKQNKDITEISIIRGLKVNTIEDHIVELAHNIKGFSIDPFVSREVQEQTRVAVKKIQSNKLKLIKKELNDEVSYFEIRLVLAKSGGENES